MQANYVPCPHCRNQLIDDGRFAGQVVQCPTCQQQFQMPGRASTVTPAVAAPTQNPFAFGNSPASPATRFIAPRPKPSILPWVIVGVAILVVGGIGVWAFNKNGVPAQSKEQSISQADATKSLPTLIKKMKDIDPAVRRSAIREIANLGPKAAPAVTPLTECLLDVLTRDDAAVALGRIGPAAKSAAPALFGILDEDSNQRKNLQLLLDKIDPKRGTKYREMQKIRGQLPILESKLRLLDDKFKLKNQLGEGGEMLPMLEESIQAITNKKTEIADLTLEILKDN